MTRLLPTSKQQTVFNFCGVHPVVVHHINTEVTITVSHNRFY